MVAVRYSRFGDVREEQVHGIKQGGLSRSAIVDNTFVNCGVGILHEPFSRCFTHICNNAFYRQRASTCFSVSSVAETHIAMNADHQILEWYAKRARGLDEFESDAEEEGQVMMMDGYMNLVGK